MARPNDRRRRAVPGDRSVIAVSARLRRDVVAFDTSSFRMGAASRDGTHRRGRFTEVALLGLLVVIAVAVNITKPVHIDDTAYLEIAQAILRDPWRPLSQRMNWADTIEPIFNINQPLLVPYAFATVMLASGSSELALHVFMVIPTMLAIVFFHRLASIAAPCRATWLTGIFALGPAFLPGQNLMTDVPVIACWLIAFALLLRPGEQRGAKGLLGAGGAIGAAVVTKYVSIVLLPIFAAVVLRRGRSLWVYIAMPIAVLVAWSLFNIADAGAIHLFGRPRPSLSWVGYRDRLIEVVAGLGALSPFVLSLLPGANHPWPKGTQAVVVIVAMTTGA
ncbi:MAG TPA: glycosyltransferase family 39 protein, partial [Gemmatimonadaceae bacterium]